MKSNFLSLSGRVLERSNMTEARITDIRQLRKLHCKYASVLSYIALLNKEIARNAAILEAKREMRRSEKLRNEKKEN